MGNHSESAMKQLIKYTPHMRPSTRLCNLITLIQFNTNLDNLSATPYIAFSINLLQKIYTLSDFLLTITNN